MHRTSFRSSLLIVAGFVSATSSAAEHFAAGMQTAIFPFGSENAFLSPDGPRVSHTGNAIEVSLGAGMGQGRIRGLYDSAARLQTVEVFNPRGKRIEWSEFKEDGSFETARDLGESGAATEWITFRASNDGTRVSIVHERWDRTKGRRIVVRDFRRPALESGETSCSTPDAPPFVAASAVGDIIARMGDSTPCPARPEDAGFHIFGSDTHSFHAVGPVCVDSACALDDAFVKRLFRDTLTEGTRCLADLGMKRLQAADQATARQALSQAVAGRISDENAAFLQKSFALKNAAQLILLFNQGENSAGLWNEREQTWFSFDPGSDEPRRASRAELTESLGMRSPGPIKIVCAQQGLSLSTEAIMDHGLPTPDGHPTSTAVKVSSAGSLVPFSGGAASATLPGSPGHPLIHFLRQSVNQESDISDRKKSMLFHEMMHLIGYTHAEDQVAGSDMENAPVHTACQACCFPEALLSELVLDNPQSKARCLSYRTLFCDLCSGAKGTTSEDVASPAFQSIKASYGKDIRDCYKIGNPY